MVSYPGCETFGSGVALQDPGEPGRLTGRTADVAILSQEELMTLGNPRRECSFQKLSIVLITHPSRFQPVAQVWNLRQVKINKHLAVEFHLISVCCQVMVWRLTPCQVCFNSQSGQPPRTCCLFPRPAS